MIGKALNAVLGRFNRKLQCVSTFRMIDEERLALRELHALASMPGDRTGAIGGIVFTKDRPTQLHALLTSYLRHAADPVPLNVLYKAGTDAHIHTYREVFDCFAPELVRPVAQGDFRADVLALLASIGTERVLFLVDDIVFIEPFAFADFLPFDWLHTIPALRLGRGLDICYTREKPQKEPPYLAGVVDNERFVAWRWKEGEHEYAFPLSLDGHIFGRREIEIIAQHSQFAAPNTFENALQIYLPSFENRIAVSYAKPCLVNVPLNRVQEEWHSRHGGTHQDELLEAWNQGLRWDVAALDGYRNHSTHEEVEVKLVPR